MTYDYKEGVPYDYQARAKHLLDMLDRLPLADRILALEAIEAEATRKLVKLRLGSK
jgi:hypothetical protein